MFDMNDVDYEYSCIYTEKVQNNFKEKIKIIKEKLEENLLKFLIFILP